MTYKGEWPARPTAHRKDCSPFLIAQLCQHGHSLQVGGFLVLNLPLPGPAVQHSVGICILSERAFLLVIHTAVCEGQILLCQAGKEH